jgi:hypothetical protein
MARKKVRKKVGRFGLFTETIVNTGDTAKEIERMRGFAELHRMGLRSGTARGKVKTNGNPFVYVNEKGEPTTISISQRSKAAQTIVEPWQELKFPGVVQTSIERQRAIDLMVKYRDGKPAERTVFLVKTEMYWIYMCFNEDHDNFHFAEIFWKKKEVRRSISFGSRNQALNAYQHERISWYASESFE